MPAHPNDPRVLERIRRMSGEERVRLGFGLQAMAERIAATGVRHAHPDWNDDQIQTEVQRRIERSRALYRDDSSIV